MGLRLLAKRQLLSVPLSEESTSHDASHSSLLSSGEKQQGWLRTQLPPLCCSSGPRQLSQQPGISTSLSLFDTNISLAREANTDQPLTLPEQKGTISGAASLGLRQLSLPGQNSYTHNKQKQFARHIATRLDRRSFLLQVLICLASSSHFSTLQNGTQVSAHSLDLGDLSRRWLTCPTRGSTLRSKT